MEHNSMESKLKEEAAAGDGSRGFLIQDPNPADPQLTLLPLPPRLPMDAFLRSSSAAFSSSTLAPSPSPTPFPEDHHVGGKPFSFSSLLAGVVNSSSASVLQHKQGNSPQGGSGQGVKEGMPLRGGCWGEREARLLEGASKGVGVSDGATSRTSTARFKSMPPSRLPIPSTGCVTIPPGLSPTTLLDSPVLFAMHQLEPSPTTGTFPLPPLNVDTKPSASRSCGTSETSSGFVFKPFVKPGPRNSLPALTSLASRAVSHQQALERVRDDAQEPSAMSSPVTMPPTPAAMPPTPTSNSVPVVPENEADTRNQVPPLQVLHEEKVQEPKITLPTALEGHSNHVQSLAQGEKPSNDGYNWRKYGQKLVKGRKTPRSYYKCSHPSCQMKKKVEQNLDGKITEIIYRGEHNHPRPPAPFRALQKVVASSALVVPKDDGTSGEKTDSEDHLKSADIELSSRLQSQKNQHSPSNPELSSPSIHEDEDGGKISGGDGNENELDCKRRKIEKDIKGTVCVPKTICEPRVVVQTISEFEVLDDGYRWRKYGQKIVKRNPYPRSYYRCSNMGCLVRKHVERSPKDPDAVITTYEGRHNHDVPTAKAGSHGTVPTAGASPSAVQATIGKQGSGLRNGGSSQGDRSEFANIATIVARHLGKAQAERNVAALQFQNGVHGSSSSSLRQDNKQDRFFSFIKSEPDDNQAAMGNIYMDRNARYFHDATNQLSKVAAQTIIATIEPKKEQSDGYTNSKALPYQSSSV